MEPLSIAAGGLSLIKAGTSVTRWSKKLLKLKDSPEALSSLIKEITDLQSLIDDVEDLIRCHAREERVALPSNVLYTIEQAKNTVLTLEKLVAYDLTNVDPATGDLKVDKSAWLKAGSKITQMTDNVRLMRQQLTTSLSLVNNASILECLKQGSQVDITVRQSRDRIESTIETLIKDAVLTRDEEDILNWLSSIDVSETYNRSLDLREAGTGKWLLGSSEYNGWLSNAHTFLWLHGISGCGKTFLCTTIIESLTSFCADSGNILVYWYFDFNNAEKQVTDNLLRSLIRQLVAATHRFPQVVSTLASEFKRAGKSPSTQRLLSCLNSIIGSLNQDIYIIIDALDEMPEKRRGNMIDQIKGLWAEQHKALHLLASSRTETDIEVGLRNLVTSELDIAVALEGDVEIFVNSRLQEAPRLARWSTTQEMEIRQRLLQMHEPRFRWAALQLDAIEDCNNEAEIRETLRNIPQTLEQSYERSLARLSKRKRSKVRDMLLWLIYARRPLSLRELATVADYPFPEDVVRTCTSSLVSTSKQDLRTDAVHWKKDCQTVRIAHFSVQEYLCSEKLRDTTRDPCFYMNAELGHFEIGVRCTKELLHLDLKEYPSPSLRMAAKEPGPGGEPLRDDENNLFPNDSCLQKIYTHNPLLVYALIHCFEHARLVQPANTTTQALADLVDEFLSLKDSKCFSIYLRIVSNNCIDRIGFRDPQKVTPLYFASSRNLTENVSKLLRRNVEIDAISEDSDYRTALLAASENRHVETVQLLLDSGANVDFKSRESMRPLQIALPARDQMVPQVGGSLPDSQSTFKNRHRSRHHGKAWQDTAMACKDVHQVRDKRIAQLLLDSGATGVDIGNKKGVFLHKRNRNLVNDSQDDSED